MTKEKRDSWFEIWVRGRLGYAVPAIKMWVGTFMTFLFLTWLKPELLQKAMVFPEVITFSHVIAYILGASTIAFVLYFGGEFWIAVFFKLFKIIVHQVSPRVDGEKT